MPDSAELRDLLLQTGPLMAPSANKEGEPTATTVEEARRAFGDRVDLYVDVGVLDSLPSTLVKFENNKPIVLRHGAIKI